jgi:lysozyme family protein
LTYLICDAIRYADLKRMDTTAETLADAKAAAEEMARKYGVTVYVIGVVGEVEGAVNPHWVTDPAPKQETSASMIAGYFGFIPTMP